MWQEGADLSIDDVKMTDLITTITCPRCGHKAEENMPTNMCQLFYMCKGSAAKLKPKEGDCCVFFAPMQIINVHLNNEVRRISHIDRLCMAILSMALIENKSIWLNVAATFSSGYGL